MKKLLGTTLALAMIMPAGANAELLKNLKVSGNLDIQTTSARNIRDFATRAPNNTATAALTTGTNNDRIGVANTRVIVKMDWDLLDDVHSRVTLVKGADANARVYGGAAQSVSGLQDFTIVQEANVKIDKLMGAVDLTIGRQFYGEEGDLIVYYGPRDNFGLRLDALDIFRADWNGEHMSVTGIAGKLSDTRVIADSGLAGAANVATDLRGVVVSCKMWEMAKPSAYVYNRVSHSASSIGAGPAGETSGNGKNTNLWVAGLKAKIATGGLTASAEYAKNFGDDRTTFANGGRGPQSAKFTGWALQAKAAYKLDLDSVGAINPWAEFGLGTGDANYAHSGNGNFQAINTDYRPGGIYGRFDQGAAVVLGGPVSGVNGGSASNGLSNRVIWGGGLKVTPSAINKLTVGAAFYRYAFHRVAPNAAGQKVSRNIGSEIDVTGEWKHSENVSLKATAGTFLPGAHIRDLKDAAAAVGTSSVMNPAVMLSGDISIKF